jgi:hypothetical protein
VLNVSGVRADEFSVAITTRDKVWTSRAAARRIEPGSSVYCARCDEQVKFVAKSKALQVICNVYVDGRWARVEHFHAACYAEAGEPYGTPS